MTMVAEYAFIKDLDDLLQAKDLVNGRDLKDLKPNNFLWLNNGGKVGVEFPIMESQPLAEAMTAIRASGAFTIEVVFDLREFRNQCPFVAIEDTSLNPTKTVFEVNHYYNHQVRATHYDAAQTATTISSPNDVFTLDTPLHCLMTNDGVNTDIYVDGVLVKTQAYATDFSIWTDDLLFAVGSGNSSRDHRGRFFYLALHDTYSDASAAAALAAKNIPALDGVPASDATLTVSVPSDESYDYVIFKDTTSRRQIAAGSATSSGGQLVIAGEFVAGDTYYGTVVGSSNNTVAIKAVAA